MHMQIITLTSGDEFDYSITGYSACTPWEPGMAENTPVNNEGAVAATTAEEAAWTDALAEDPATGQEGDTYWNTTNNVLMIYKDGSWQSVVDVRAANGL